MPNPSRKPDRPWHAATTNPRGMDKVETDDWPNTTVVVTGAARGQGAAEAALFAAAGANVILGDVDADAAARTAAGISGRARGIRLDVTRNEDWLSLVAELEHEPPVRVLVNNAGVHWF